jgi:hypothetical protein
MTTGVPVLEELVGTPWPGGLTTVREDRSVNVRGYDGWFDSREDEIVIGEELDQELLFHELMHAWASPSSFQERWLYEGIAQDLAARAVTDLGDKARRARPVSAKGKQAVPLNTWSADAGGRAQPSDDYGYPASYVATKTLLDGVGDDARSAVLAAAVAGHSAYAVSGEPRLTAGRTGWQRFLDLVEVVGDNGRATRTFKTWVLTPKERKQLKARTPALEDYRDVDEADGAFVPPLGLRAAMTDWDFSAAQEAIGQVADLGPAAVAVQEAAARHGMDVPEGVVALYQDAEGEAAYAELADTLPRAAAAVDAVGTATEDAAASRNPLATLGARVGGVDDKAALADRLLAEGDLDGATTAAQEATAAAGRSTLVGAGMVAGGLAFLAGLVLLGVMLRRRLGRRQQARADAAAAASLAEERARAAGVGDGPDDLTGQR